MKNKSTTINYYSLHYHMKECGVKTVIEEIFNSLKFIENSCKRNINENKLISFNDFYKIKFKLNLLYSSKKHLYKNSKIKIFDIPEIDYSDKIYKNFEELNNSAKKIKNKILSCLDLEKNCILHAHNVNLFKNSALGQAIKLLSTELKDNKNFIILLQVHDFAEDKRKDRLSLMQKCCGKDYTINSKILDNNKNTNLIFNNIAGINNVNLAFPLNNNIHYLTINSRDKTLLKRIGIPEEKISLFPNCLETNKFMINTKNINKLKKNLLEFAINNNYNFELDRKIISSPIKIIKRKNVIESLLILNLLNSVKDEWQLLITLEPNSDNDIKYCEAIKKHVKKYKLPVTIGFGKVLLERNYSDAIKNKRNTITDLLKISDVILTTSIQEGFGFTYLEGWLADKKVVGRRLEHIFKDFENNKINLKHFYSKILIKNKDFKDYSTSEQLKLLKEIDYKKLSSKPELKNLINFINYNSKVIIEKNKKQIISNYSIENYGGNLINIIYYNNKNQEIIDNHNTIKKNEKTNNQLSGEKKKEIIKKTKKKRKHQEKDYNKIKLDNSKLIKYFEKNN
jgi:hypothetical protein